MNNQLQLVTYEQAKRLKEIGFDYPTENLFYDYGSTSKGLYSVNPPENHNDQKCQFSAPTVLNLTFIKK